MQTLIVPLVPIMAALTMGLVPSDPPKKVESLAVPEALTRYLRELKGAKWGSLTLIKSGALEAVFPKRQFFSLQFRRYPSEVVPTPPLKSNNVFVVLDGKVDHIASEAELSRFFVERFPANSDAAFVKAATESWLRLIATLRQDGYYEFDEPTVKVGTDESQGTLAVKPKTGKGELHVTMKFKDGRLTAVESRGELVPGRRLR